MAKPRWYDRFAPFYDAGTIGDLFYRKPRKAAIDQLNLSSGDSVADVFCGTGVDFPLLANRVGEKGKVLAVDGSSGMLEQAKARAEQYPASRRFEFLRADFSEVDGLNSLKEAIDKEAPRHVFFSLGLTCLANWREFCSLMFDAAPSGTRFSIMDVYSERLTLGARFINWIGAADCRRPVWKVLEERCESFAWEQFRPFKVLDVSVVVASGSKP
ncbi:Ubiquinone/menaquinone biosynthesis methyltransferase [Marinobacter santoriniensis NKSG1]|uniref:Ubiquinone/menaquinone biosynthesis methyltransferase n=1 Tax=Marinobacter santoriniensis NKSG1 TaxID=1288826 RepID=M7CWJ9_9GAMM|nr:class I SAM-dependent methyltransferase [Marinobacter santoriniensis]EMP56615.1 Ubiquinone/menaquinone biosynthesis methyltransferase [Marinobacter santoriniensis NKSG1]